MNRTNGESGALTWVRLVRNNAARHLRDGRWISSLHILAYRKRVHETGLGTWVP
jgi:hypothetical protein